MTARSPVRLALALAASSAVAACATSARSTPAPESTPTTAGSGDERAAFLVRLGSDTLAGEQFTRTATTLTGTSVVRSPATVLRSYTATLRPDGTVERLELTARRAAATAPPQRVTMTFVGDSVNISTQVGDSTPRTSQLTVDAPALPYLGNAFALLELATRAARRAAQPGADTTKLAMVATIGRAIPATVTRLGADSMLISLGGGAPYRAHVDADGRILGLQGTPTQQVVVTRVDAVNVPVLSAERPMGTLSPTDTVRGQIGTSTITVVYSRPSKRGRTILGGVVPYDQVWRTGANAATILTTSGDLTVGGVVVPAGSYTLWTLPSRSGWKLIVNRQTGQWGTEYDASRDLARIDVTRSPAPGPTEQFTIVLDATGGSAGRLRMTWDDFELMVPVVTGR